MYNVVLVEGEVCVVSGERSTVSPVEGGEPSAQLQVRGMQEDMLVVRVFGWHTLRMVWCHCKLSCFRFCFLKKSVESSFYFTHYAFLLLQLFSCTNVRAIALTYICLHTLTHTYTNTHPHAHSYTNTYTHSHSHTHTHTHTHTYIHTYIHTHSYQTCKYVECMRTCCSIECLARHALEVF